MDLHPNLKPGKKEYELYDGIDYVDFWKGTAKSKLDILEQAIINDLLPRSGKCFLDLGCGYGRLFPIYSDRFEKIIMLDGSMTYLQQAKANTDRKAILVAGNVYHLPLKNNSFDAAILVRVFQHLTDPMLCLREIHRVIGQGGKFIFNYYNKKNPSRLVKWFLKKQTNNPFIPDPEGIGTEFISHHPVYVDELLKETGFIRQEKYGAGILDKLSDKAGKFGKWIPLGKSISPFIGTTNLAPWIFCANSVMDTQPLHEFESLMDIFQCPSCQGDLALGPGSYLCHTCARIYPISDGIVDFRI